MLPGPVLTFELGSQHTCAILADGGLRCWGLNERGQLGYGNLNNLGDGESLATLPPVSVPPAIAIGLGDRHTCARVGIGQVRCWGRNDSGELGYANPTPELLLPGEPVAIGGIGSGLAVGDGHSCVTFVDGGLRCWGRNDAGQLGQANLTTIGDDELPSVLGLVDVVPARLPVNTEVVEVALGASHACARLNGGELICWGANGSGQLGYGDLVTTGDDEIPSTRPPVDIGGPAKSVVAGSNHTCALRTDGAVICWGANASGQLGYGSTAVIGDDELPVSAGPVDLGESAQQLTAGGDHTCALLSGGEVACWGANEFGQLGLGTVVTVGDNEVPADVPRVQIISFQAP
jgi:alpha-tubulin suppressor-like RCC1 family protein